MNQIMFLCDPQHPRDFWGWCCINGIKEMIPSSNCEVVTTTSIDEVMSRCQKQCFLLSSNTNWTYSTADQLVGRGIQPIVLGFNDHRPVCRFSSVAFDYSKAIYDFLSRISSIRGPLHVAILFPKRFSCTDSIKVAAIEQIDTDIVAYCRYFFTDDGWNAENAVDTICKSKEHYDVLLFTTDLAQFAFENALHSRAPDFLENTYSFSFRENYRNSAVSAAYYDWMDIGREGVRLYDYLLQQRSGLNPNVTVKLEMSLHIVSSPTRFSVDKIQLERSLLTSEELIKIKTQLLTCDQLDIDILRLYASGIHRSDIAQYLYTSESTVGYRLRRFMKQTGCQNLKQLRLEMAAFFY